VTLGWGENIGSCLRLMAVSTMLSLPLAGGAIAQGIVPADLFNAPMDTAGGIAVEANSLVFEASTQTITAQGDVVVRNGGYTATGQNLVYNRGSGEVHFIGDVRLVDPSGNVIETRDLKLTGGMSQAFIDSLAITTYDGAQITAASADYDKALQTLLVDARYAPCGDCIDDQGRRIGWSVSAARIIYNAEDESVELEQPSLALLGIPVLWLPYLWLPNTSEAALDNFRSPTVGYSEETGASLAVPYVAYSSKTTDVIFTPTLMSRQGFLLGAEWIQRFDQGSFNIKASGLYQLDPTAFSFVEAQERWRGAIQTSGEFRPVEDWTVGWSYTAFTDAAYLGDYNWTDAKSSTDEIYATNLTSDTYIDVRLQQFNQLGDVTEATQQIQADAVPNARFDHVTRLAEGFGQIEVSGRLLGVHRELDHVTSANGVPYDFGYAGNKTHAAFQAGWTTQWIGGGGFVATPYLGGRADVAYYDGNSPLPQSPGETTLWSATPIAAMDVRFPMAASDGSTVHLVEPIAQLVYRGGNQPTPGITNDDAQSFVFDDTNMFSFNRFSGYDRQETGLRANIGGRYQANFVDGSYIEMIAGQSFQLAGTNAFAAADPAQTGVGSGLEEASSYAVLGAYAGLFDNTIKLGGKLQVDTDEIAVARAGMSASYSDAGYSAFADYHYIAANADLGVLDDQHEVGAGVGVPIADYWTVNGSAYWDITANSFLQASVGVTYDDGYLMVGASATQTGPTHTSPDDTRFTATFRIKAPAGFNLGDQFNF